MNKLIVLFSFSILIFTSCERDPVIETPDRSGFGYDFYPLEIGKYITYQVDSLQYDESEGITIESSFELREEIVDTIRDNQNRLGYRIERYRKNPGEDWQIHDIVAAFNTETTAERLENNLRFVNLSFPVEEGKSWDGTAHIDPTIKIFVAGESIEMFKNWTYEILAVDDSIFLEGLAFNNVMTVLQVDEDNLVERRYSRERYAKGVGLIYKEQIILDTQCGGNPGDCIGMPWEEKAEKGYILEMRAIDYN